MAGASYAQVQWEGPGQQRPGCYKAILAGDKAVLLSSGVALKSTVLHKNMAPGKAHVNLKLKHKFQARQRNSSGVKKAKNSSIPKRKVRSSIKELKTFRNIFSFLYVPFTLVPEAFFFLSWQILRREPVFFLLARSAESRENHIPKDI